MRKKRSQPENAMTPEPRRVTPVDIQQKEFRLAMRGYNERDVDQFLDEVTEEVARLYADNKRLREEVEFGSTTRLQTTGAAEADAIIRQAREEAARIIAEATARASTIGTGQSSGDPATGGDPPRTAPPSEIMSIFLARERAFLQNMANLIQAHAEGVKQDVRRVRDQVDRPGPAVAAAAAAPGAEPAGGYESHDPPGRHEATESEVAAAASVDEPTQAWEPASDDEPGSNEHDVVDLTRDDTIPETAHEEGTASGFESDREPQSSALSGAYGRTPSTDVGASLGGPDERAAAARRSPGVEEDDSREDRSIRELFWGEG